MINLLHKTAFIALLATQSYVVHAQVDSTTYFQVQKVLAETRADHAPDKRTAILELADANVTANEYTIITSEAGIKEILRSALAGFKGSYIIHTLPDTSVGAKQWGVVNLSVANLRTKPAHSAEMATQLLMGAVVDILQKDGGDFLVRTPEGYIAWVPTSSIVPMSEASLSKWKQKRIIYTDEFGKSYSQPDLKSVRVSDLVYGNVLSLVGEDRDFYKVSYPDQRTAYIPKKEATMFDDWLQSRQLTPENVLASAKSMLGLPYLWGGTSVKGVDCSGFTKTSYFMNGYVIPRDASQQVLHGEPVDILDAAGNFDPDKALKNLKPADLLFFAGGKQKQANPRVTHVALYMGNGTFIHAAGTVRINSMLKGAENYDDFQTRTVVAARRYIGSNDPAIQKVEENPYYKNN
ncbi:NlpC/P60 family protein [Sphingobacterium allocomposti]|uniref:NlpC/P60 family protein n=1 Tax=Sphingobacterium allocomposti TaxID=415956 RepID=A0A5S5DNR8_9SPHI|nr:NlpC/P60 family protein [Sphingobacterium composti Yoo et al. 2007 non Ten et al. 2007]TYP96676.1 NlpC/P60 family protein [Sphingobacterium composti Yoo et al. 2007 non Ten et al. 2007]